MNGSRNTSGGTADRLLGMMKQNPEALLLLAAGCAMLMRSSPASAGNRRSGTGSYQRAEGMYEGATEGMYQGAEGMRGSTSEMADQTRRYTSDVADQARRYTSDVADQARDTVGSFASAASRYADNTRRTISEQSQQMYEQSQQMFQQTQSTLQSAFDRVLRDQPLMVAFAGLAAGAALAATFAPTDLEKDVLGPVGERVGEAAAEMGERLKGAAAEATETLKEAAERRGMTPDGLKEMASEVGGAFSSHISDGGQRGNQASQGSGAGASQPGRSNQASQTSGVGGAQPGRSNQASHGSGASTKEPGKSTIE